MQAHSSSKDFVILSQLGKGSFGIVFKVRRVADDKLYVMKQLHIGSLRPKEQAEALNEVHILAALNHAYVTRYYDSFIEGGVLSIIMELAEHGTLSDRLKSLKGRSLDEGIIWQFFLQLCVGLHYIHEKKILHRDIKTANIFLDANDDIKIGDLGVAKVLNTSQSFAQTIVGTPYYLSPELCEEKPYNEKSDVWALGCVLYELCTGRHPFDAANQGALILKIIRGKYPPISASYSAELQVVLTACLSRDTAVRPNVAELLSRPAVYAKARQLGIDMPVGIRPNTPKLPQVPANPIRTTTPTTRREMRKQPIAVRAARPVKRVSPPPKAVSASPQRNHSPPVKSTSVQSTARNVAARHPTVAAVPTVPKVQAMIVQGREFRRPTVRDLLREEPSRREASTPADVHAVRNLPDRVTPSVRPSGRDETASVFTQQSAAEQSVATDRCAVGTSRPSFMPPSADAVVAPLLRPVAVRQLPPESRSPSPSTDDVIIPVSPVDANTIPADTITWAVHDDNLHFTVRHGDSPPPVDSFDDDELCRFESDTALSQPDSEINRLLARAEELKTKIAATRHIVLASISEHQLSDMLAYASQHADTDEEAQLMEVHGFIYARICDNSPDIAPRIFQLMYLQAELTRTESQIDELFQ